MNVLTADDAASRADLLYLDARVTALRAQVEALQWMTLFVAAPALRALRAELRVLERRQTLLEDAYLVQRLVRRHAAGSPPTFRLEHGES